MRLQIDMCVQVCVHYCNAARSSLLRSFDTLPISHIEIVARTFSHTRERDREKLLRDAARSDAGFASRRSNF